MSGTREGGLKAAESNKTRHGEDFYNLLGRKGGLKSRGGAFVNDRELASRAGRIGGRNSHRGQAKKNTVE